MGFCIRLKSERLTVSLSSAQSNISLFLKIKRDNNCPQDPEATTAFTVTTELAVSKWAKPNLGGVISLAPESLGKEPSPRLSGQPL
jgi:hypothetical protein